MRGFNCCYIVIMCHFEQANNVLVILLLGFCLEYSSVTLMSLRSNIGIMKENESEYLSTCCPTYVFVLKIKC